MAWELAFEHLSRYDPGKPGIAVPVTLRSGAIDVAIDAKFDAGASNCIFQREYGETLGFEIEKGHRIMIGTAMGAFTAYGHPVTLSVFNYDFDVMVYFPENPAINRNVLGRHGFLDRLQIGLIDYEGKFFLSRFGDNHTTV